MAADITRLAIQIKVAACQSTKNIQPLLNTEADGTAIGNDGLEAESKVTWRSVAVKHDFVKIALESIISQSQDLLNEVVSKPWSRPGKGRRCQWHNRKLELRILCEAVTTRLSTAGEAIAQHIKTASDGEANDKHIKLFLDAYLRNHELCLGSQEMSLWAHELVEDIRR
jgi:hypothetical protein